MVKSLSFRGLRRNLENLENRLVPAAFFVGNINNAGAGSLRQAILDANANAGPDTISFDAFTFATPQTISLSGGQIKSTGPLTIVGPSSKALTVQNTAPEGPTSRVFEFDAATTLSGMTVTGGNCSQYGGGIAILNAPVTMADVRVAQNISNLYGGGIAVFGGNAVVTISDSVIANNTAKTINHTVGGGLIVGANTQVTLTRCTISGNQAGDDGGGCYIDTNASVTIVASTFSGNLSDQGTASIEQLGGGGLLVKSASVTINNSTFASNLTKQSGGGILAVDFSTISLNNSTIAANIGATGGGIAATFGSKVNLLSTIVSNNAGGAHPDGEGTFTADYSLIGKSAGITLTGGNSYTGVDPLLGLLGDYGGPTQTFVLKNGSPALDTGINFGAPVDQRGMPRTVGVHTDMGATEAPAYRPAAITLMPNVTTPGGTVVTFAVTYSDLQSNIDISSINGNDLTIAGPNGFFAQPQFLGFTGSGKSIVATYSFAAPGGAWDFGDDGTYVLSVDHNQVYDTDTPLSNSVPDGPISGFQVQIGRTYVVTNSGDSGLGSGLIGDFRFCINAANQNAWLSDTITFDPTVFNAPKTIILGSPLTITDQVAVTGPGAGLVTIDAKGAGRIFTIDVPLNTGQPVAISGLTLTGGNGSGNSGGAILNVDEALTLDHVVITGNAASTDGGAVSVTNAEGSLVVRDSTLSNNTAAGQGGALNIHAASSVAIIRSTVSGNNSGADGGGIYFFSGGTLTMDASTVSGNKADMTTQGQGGGGIYGFNFTAALRNCTVSGNSTNSPGNDSHGGGISAVATSTLTLQNCTVANNNAGTNAGGGIYIGAAASAEIDSTIVSDNLAAAAPDVSGAVTAEHSLLSNVSGATITGFFNQLGASAKLAPLANNGSPTMTHALLAGSPARDQGYNPTTVTTDQRGVGFNRSVVLTDIGAFEDQTLPAPAKITSVVVNGGVTQRSRVTSIVVTFDQFVSLPGNAAQAFQLTRQTDNAIVSMNAVVQYIPAMTVTFTFTGGPVESGSLADGRYTLTVLANQVATYGQFLDGNGDGNGGDNYSLVGTPANGLFRLFGDAGGDGIVNGTDFLAFRLSFLQASPTFDFDGDGNVTGSDFLQFRLRFLQMI